jgi:Na+/phosphate symporter
LIERIEIKITEGLLFSDEGIAEYMEVLDSTTESLKMAIDVLESGDHAIAERVINNGFHVKELVERYRKTHNERLVKGICDPRTSNMFFDMLDFTGNIARHSSNAVKAFLP